MSNLNNLRTGIIDVGGWLSPEGIYYPVDIEHPDPGQRLHSLKARQLIDRFYPGNPLEYQPFLINCGWIRLDFEWVWLSRRPTEAQLQTLYQLWCLEHTENLPKTDILYCLVWARAEVLPGDIQVNPHLADQYEAVFDGMINKNRP